VSRPRPRWTLGPEVARWIESFLVHGPGDVLGQPIKLTREERRYLAWAYEVDGDGRRIVRRAVRGLPKGSRKSEFAAWCAIAEMAGPVRFDHWETDGRLRRPRGRRVHDPFVVCAAASYEQADILFGAAKAAVTEGPLASYFECFDREIQLKGQPGVLVRVPAVAGTNDGLRPSFAVFDEVHEWTGGRERVHLVLENGLAKRRDSWSLSITTAGNPNVESVALSQYRYGRRVEAGEIEDPGLLFVWREPAGVKLERLADPEVLAEVIAEANPEEWKDRDTLARRFHEIPLHEFGRYHLNLWIEPDEERWLPPGAWDALGGADPIADGATVVLGFDGSYSGDSTALVAATVEERPRLQVLGLWEHPGGGQQWTVDHDDVEARVLDAFRRFDVREMSADPPYWSQQLTRWAELFGEDRVLAFNTAVRKRMAAACSSFYQAVTTGALSHDADPGLARHCANARLKESAQGAYIVKPDRGGPARIDAAIAAVIAYNRAVWHHLNPKPIVDARVVWL